MKYRPLGELRLRRVVESVWPCDASVMFPDHADEFAAFSDCGTGASLLAGGPRLFLPIQSYIVQTRHHTILVDTCCGPDKDIPEWPEWHARKQEQYVANLGAHGLGFEDIDVVMCTHLHVDHTGWNTRLVDGRWVPTFPNARYIMARVELEQWEGERSSVYVQNVLPVVEAGRAMVVGTDFVLDDTVRLEFTPGHTSGHCCVHVQSKNETALILGDAMHSPVQCRHPHWHCAFDLDKAQAVSTRRALLERYADTGTLVCATHFPFPSAGFFVAEGDRFRFLYDRHDW